MHAFQAKKSKKIRFNLEIRSIRFTICTPFSKAEIAVMNLSFNLKG
jgi:hypothetical protein